MKKFVPAVLVVLAISNAARAAVVLHVPDIVLSSSSSAQSGSFDVWLEETEGTQATIQSYNIGVMQQYAGPLATFGTAVASSSAHPMIMNIADPFLFDSTINKTGSGGYVIGRDVYVANDSGGPNQVDNTPGPSQRDGLFSVPYTIPANTPAGTVILLNIDLSSTAIFTDLTPPPPFEGDDPVAYVADSGSITIIPEPAAMGFALLALPLLARRRR